jgi:hypothetical protein
MEEDEEKQERDSRNRIINLEKTGSGRRRVYVPLRRRAARFLATLEQTGNVSMAVEVAGIGKNRIYKHRRENEEFAAQWEAAILAFREREEREDGLDEEELEAAGLAVRRGRGGKPQIVSARPNQWSRRKEDIFLAHYRECGNVTRAARAARIAPETAWRRRDHSADFRRRFDEAKVEAVERLELRLIEEGSERLESEDSAKRDPQLAMWLLKRRDAEASGRLNKGAAWARPRSLDETRASILKKLSAIAARHQKEQIAQGWSRDEEGRMIPPGWIWTGGGD